MNLASILSRVERRLIVVGLSADKASKKAGKPDAIRNLRRAVNDGDRHGVTSSTLAALAPVLQTSLSWLLEERGPEEMLPESQFAEAGGPPVSPDAALGYILKRIAKLEGELRHMHQVNRNLAERVEKLENIPQTLGMPFERQGPASKDEREHPVGSEGTSPKAEKRRRLGAVHSARK